jgi:hypothetical protein
MAAVIPTVTVQAAVSIDYASETLNGNITVVGDDLATERGFNVGLTTAYGTDFKETGSFSTGAFKLPATGLAEFTTNHVRAYATNVYGTGHSADTTFKTVKNPTTNYSGTLAPPMLV